MMYMYSVWFFKLNHNIFSHEEENEISSTQQELILRSQRR